MIRKGAREDFEQIYQLGETLHSNFRSVYQLDNMLEKDYFFIYVYEEANQILGFITFTNLEGMVDILDIVVDNQHRRKKIATNLLDVMITNLKKEDKIYLEVATSNTAAISLYEKFGFQKIHTRKKYYGKEDAYVMERVMENE